MQDMLLCAPVGCEASSSLQEELQCWWLSRLCVFIWWLLTCRDEQCPSSRCMFEPWLHRSPFISMWMFSRQASHPKADCLCHTGGNKEKVAVKATPLPSRQPHGPLRWGWMTHPPWVHLSLTSSLCFSIPPSHKFTSSRALNYSQTSQRKHRCTEI